MAEALVPDIVPGMLVATELESAIQLGYRDDAYMHDPDAWMYS